MEHSINAKLEIRHEPNQVILEPPAVHGVRGFTVYLTPEAARLLGHRLIGASTQAMPLTTKGSKE